MNQEINTPNLPEFFFEEFTNHWDILSETVDDKEQPMNESPKNEIPRSPVP